MLMRVKDFLAPTRGRILIFLVIFLLVFVYDTMFAPFPGSPVADNMGTQEGATSFLLYILLLPYILSCLLPAFLGLRKRKFLRLANLTEFMHPRPDMHKQKHTMQQTFVFPTGTEKVESKTVPAKPGPIQSTVSSAKKSAKPIQRKAAKPAKK
jgi:hypothetical protein